jgi:hypothetical protein
MISQECAYNIVMKAFLSVCQVDGKLLESNANERSITHRLAVYIEREIPFATAGVIYDVDCEYNRSNEKPKRLTSFKRRIDSDNADGVTVYPDVIVHQRGTNCNLIVVEAKLDSSEQKCVGSLSCICDRCKLKAYKHELGYTYAFFVTFPTRDAFAGFNPERLEGFIELISDEKI